MLHRCLKSLSLRTVFPAMAIMLSLGAPAYFSLQAAAVASPAKARMLTVQIKNFAFVPAVVTVTPGTTVTWINTDEDPHTVTATNKSFHSAAIDTSGRYTFTFRKAGDFAYFCSLHPHMTGKVIVKA